jgi:anti-sigma regulatory factor (Ser/Thr protein kinase)
MHASMLRRELRRWLDDDVTEDEAGDIALSAYEAIAEIVTQTDPLDAGPIRLQAHLDDDHVRVAISYTGNWDAPSDPEHSQHRLTLIRALTDHAILHRDEHTITMYLTTYRQPPASSDKYPSR